MIWRPTKLAACVAATGGVVTAISGALPWVRVGLESPSTNLTGLQILPVVTPVLLAAILTVSLSLGSLRGRPELARLAVFTSGFGVTLAVLAIVLMEIAAPLLPAWLLPPVLEPAILAVGTGAGVGAWVALLGSSISTAALLGWKPKTISLHSWGSGQSWRRLLALRALLILTVFIAWLRYEAWIAASDIGHRIELPGSAAPWIGPLSLFAVGMLAGALILAWRRSDLLAGLVAATAGWLISFLAALGVVAVNSIGSLGIGALISEDVAPAFHCTPFVWLTFVSGLAAAAAGAFLVHAGSTKASWPPS